MQIKVDKLEFMHQMSAELAQLAKADSMQTLSYLYSMAEQEAAGLLAELRHTVSRPRPKRPPDTPQNP